MTSEIISTMFKTLKQGDEIAGELDCSWTFVEIFDGEKIYGPPLTKRECGKANFKINFRIFKILI